jgi:adenosylcobinamide kinase / adenosylcobinamide-phosphate guanylyltransferase
VEVRLAGTGGGRGWPRPDCRCASCERARSAGRRRAPTRVLVDGVLGIDPGTPPVPGPAASGYRVERVPGAWAVTGPDGARLLVGDGPGDEDQGTPPRAGAGAAGGGPYDLVLLDLLDNPAQLGALRRRGLVHARTVAAVLHADHRISSEEELARRGRYWGVTVPDDGDVLTAAPAPASPAAGPAAGRGLPRRVLVLGGARSGKSRHAELRLAAEPRVTYLAAGPYPPASSPSPSTAQPAADADWAERVAAHRARRPPWWQTVESLDVAATLRSECGAVLVDGAGTWLAAVMDEYGAWAEEDGDAGPASAEARIAARVDELLEAWRQTRALVVVVSDEVGSGIHPPTRAGRLFRDQLGWLNQRLAAESEEAVLMVAGRALTLPS